MRNAHSVLVLGLLLGCVNAVRAHGIGAECRLRGDKVEVEAYYDDDTSAGNAKVTVWDAAKKEVTTGRTDAKGRWSFPAPPAGVYEVVVDAGAGHRATIRITIPAEGQPAEGTTGPAKTTADDSTARVSDGPSREEFTRFPWEKLALGLAAAAIVGLLARGFARLARS